MCCRTSRTRPSEAWRWATIRLRPASWSSTSSWRWRRISRAKPEDQVLCQISFFDFYSMHAKLLRNSCWGKQLQREPLIWEPHCNSRCEAGDIAARAVHIWRRFTQNRSLRAVGAWVLRDALCLFLFRSPSRTVTAISLLLKNSLGSRVALVTRYGSCTRAPALQGSCARALAYDPAQGPSTMGPA